MAEVLASNRLLNKREVTQKTSKPSSSIYADMAKGLFPKAIKISQNRVAWLESEIDAWIAERVSSARGAK